VADPETVVRCLFNWHAVLMRTAPEPADPDERRPRLSAAEQVIRELEDLIFRGFRAGSSLPSESELATRLGVSRLTAREAMKSLQARGLVEIRHGRRPVVAHPTAAPVSDFFMAAVRRDPRGPSDLLEVRRALEVHIAGLAAQRASRAAVAGLELSLEAMRRAVSNLAEFNQADIQFHESLADACGNQILSLLIEALEGPLRASRLQSIQGHFARGKGINDVIDQHARIFERVRERDSEGAADAMRDHLVSTEQDLRAAMVLHEGAVVGDARAAGGGAPPTSTT
jgi:GntR family transcriptional regulator, transcriptional repressor for pyruvate dehydrogenase complex